VFQAAAANFALHSEANVNTANEKRGPLISGKEDHTVPDVTTRSTLKQYRNSSAVTALKTVRGSRALAEIDSGWREVADATLEWLAPITIYPKRDVCVITCLDPRTDPAKPVIDDVAFITYLSETKIKPDGPLFEVAVIHHNKCGTSFLANADFRDNFATHRRPDVALRGLGSRVDLLATFDQERAERACQRGDHGDRIDLHNDVENPPRERDRVLDAGGDREQLRGSPEQSAS
jgi:hypothetical protein